MMVAAGIISCRVWTARTFGSVERGGRRRAGRCGAGGERECSSLIIYSSTFVLECIVVGGGGVTSFVVHEVYR